LSRTRSLSIESVWTSIDLQIAANPYREEYPSPLVLCNLLNTKTTLLKSSLSTIDSSYLIVASEFIRYKPTFVAPPSLVYNDYEIASF